jgi:hypothetical protein
VIPPRHRVHVRRRLWAALRMVGIAPERLHRLGLSPIRVIGLAEADVRRFVEAQGAKVLRAEPDDAVGGLASFQYYVSPPSRPILDR